MLLFLDGLKPSNSTTEGNVPNSDTSNEVKSVTGHVATEKVSPTMFR